jgi:hypothetical protein
MICTILLQDLMKRGVCKCRVEMFLLIRFSSHICLVLLPSCLRVGARCFWILDLMLQWWCSKLVSALPSIFFFVLFVWLLMCMFRCSFDVILFWCFFACLFVCALDAYACFIWMLCLYVFVCSSICMHPSSFGSLISLCRESAKTKLFWCLDHILVTKWHAKGTIQLK